jgi:hypothetical protein
MRAGLAVVGLASILWLNSAAAVVRAETWPGFEGIWAWGTLWNSHDTPFLRITHNADNWKVETKHYMHAYFRDKVRDLRIDGKHLEFSYWYEPRERWAHCRFNAAIDTMAGFCDAEINMQDWGAAPSYLWRQPSVKESSP